MRQVLLMPFHLFVGNGRQHGIARATFAAVDQRVRLVAAAAIRLLGGCKA
jgi:hypothetical protein